MIIMMMMIMMMMIRLPSLFTSVPNVFSVTTVIKPAQLLPLTVENNAL